SRQICIFLLSTYTGGEPAESARWFYTWLQDTVSDFRVQKTLLSKLNYAVFGLGNSVYQEHFNSVAKDTDSWLHKLHGNRILPLGIGDNNVVQSENGGLEEDFVAWKGRILRVLNLEITPSHKPVDNEVNVAPSKIKVKENVIHEGKITSESSDNSEDEETIAMKKNSTIPIKNDVVDVEDLGVMLNNLGKAKADRELEVSTLQRVQAGPKTSISSLKKAELRDMVTPSLKEALSKQGYKIIGSHSGVKLCRWTKSMLRGRGGCYKHTFYGIESHRCMETTPSLACANKCVFCWRHHTNPVGTEWRWKMDDPEKIFNEALKNHYGLIKQFKGKLGHLRIRTIILFCKHNGKNLTDFLGVPGVQTERFKEAMEVKHCALSLVGEPIMYPEINKFIELLHGKEISSFLVTNAQFPNAIRDLTPVTQLYVSVDASTKESLKKIDRPLFKDFWPRFLKSLSALSEKGQRTVYRLTLVKAWNAEEIEAYANLVGYGNPDFIEVKGVTYCGESKASKLTMENIPWHQEVLSFTDKLVDNLPEYEIACEHEHSNCVLVAHKKFKVHGRWHTWIDYAKFHKLIAEFASNGGKNFDASDYMALTPDWAVIGHPAHGFDPVETRWHRKKNNKDIGGC
ncbi:uncharacterized protein TRIADDRAFT_28630, partial [Trichoplax adhaerens]